MIVARVITDTSPRPTSTKTRIKTLKRGGKILHCLFIVRDQHPLKQGLRPECRRDDLIHFQARPRPTSTKTRIKTSFSNTGLAGIATSPRPTSTKTRIKTVRPAGCRPHHRVRDQHPLKQGLRPRLKGVKTEALPSCPRPTSTKTRIKTVIRPPSLFVPSQSETNIH